MRKILLILTFVVLVLVWGYYYYLPKVRWQKAVEAVGGYSYVIGLTNSWEIPCIVSCNGGCCQGGTLCTIKAPGVCAAYSEIDGTMAGGDGVMALFSDAQIMMAGYKPGDSIIAGGLTMSEMDNGVLAAPGGCAGCGLGKADSSLFDRIAGIVKYIIAGIKE
jgi:hypothetical protein